MTAVVIAGLALPGVAGAKQVTYAGTIEGGGKIALDIKVNKRNKPKSIVQARAVEMNLSCDSGNYDDGYAAFDGPIAVNERRRFDASYEQPVFGNESRIEGKFKRNKKKVSGTFVFDYHFLASKDLPEEDCTTGVVEFKAKRGADDGTQPYPPERSARR